MKNIINKIYSGISVISGYKPFPETLYLKSGRGWPSPDAGQVKADHPVESTSQIKIPVEVYSRVVGYYRPVNQWHKGKQQEWADRLPYKINIESLKI